MNEKFATTFGGSGYTPDSIQYQDGIRLGTFLAEQGYTVKCGGYYGLMEAVSQGVHEAGGQIRGITNTSFDPKDANRFITEEQKQPDLFDRIRQLIDGEDASELLVSQEGSLGTLTEVFATWCLAYTQSLSKPVRLCLVGKAWPEVIASLESLPVNKEDYQLIELYDEMDQFFDTFH
ncbi:LOG family protein [Patescibacteria group bacterium]|nr:LOG family protein [Patescibacteria group bacterium]MBU1911887.1 LOG family protein [Patescibacteria group bacterium]